jgi:hypothetical protein
MNPDEPGVRLPCWSSLLARQKAVVLIPKTPDRSLLSRKFQTLL